MYSKIDELRGARRSDGLVIFRADANEEVGIVPRQNCENPTAASNIGVLFRESIIASEATVLYRREIDMNNQFLEHSNLLHDRAKFGLL